MPKVNTNTKKSKTNQEWSLGINLEGKSKYELEAIRKLKYYLDLVPDTLSEASDCPQTQEYPELVYINIPDRKNAQIEELEQMKTDEYWSHINNLIKESKL